MIWDNVSFFNNTSTCGVVRVKDWSNVSIKNGYFSHNKGVRGGVFYFTGFTIAHLENNIFTHNLVTNQAGCITHENYAIASVIK